MGRRENLKEFMDKYDNVSFMAANIPLILQNLKKADEDGCLRQFFLNKKPYQSAFPFIVFNDNQKAARGKDQVALVFALNLYGAEHPGFATKINTLLKTLACGSAQEAQSVMVLMRAQIELQQMEISLINFVDQELLANVNAAIRRLKGPKLALAILCLLGGAIGMPGFSIIGLFPLTFAAIGLFVYGFMKIPYWLGLKAFPDDLVASAQWSVGEC
jgi:hypothetical protein